MPEKCPTVIDLVHLGLARAMPTVKGQGTRYWISDEGHALMGRILRANGREAAEKENR